MKINQINPKNNPINFRSGKAILYSDFDGTFLPQSLKDIYIGEKAEKQKSIIGFNKYFKDFQDFIDKTKNKFEINITTGRRLNPNDRHDGFKQTYDKILKEGVVLPKINSLTNSKGGDTFYFNPDGTINPNPSKAKISQIKKLSDWDSDIINQTIKEISLDINSKYNIDSKDTFHLSIETENKFALVRFQKRLADKMDISIKIDEDGAIKLTPKINSKSLDKSFDTILALKEAQKNNDFLLVAGNARNDKEMLNIFNYVSYPIKNVPYKASDIDLDYVKKIKKEIDNLPIKILFIKPKDIKNINEKDLELYEFMKKCEELFSKNVQIVEQTELYNKNNFLDAIKKSILSYSKRNLGFLKKFNYKSYLISKISLIGSASLIGLAIALWYNKNETSKR